MIPSIELEIKRVYAEKWSNATREDLALALAYTGNRLS